MNDTVNITVLGAGAWGTALAIAASRAGNNVTLHGRNQHVIEDISKNHRNSKYLPGIKFDTPPDNQFAVTTDFIRAVGDANMILLAIPAQQISSLAEKLANVVREDVSLVCCAKGIDRNSGKLPAELLAEHIPGAAAKSNIAALSGPSFAADLARGLPTAVTVASDSITHSNRLASQLSSSRFRCYASSDLTGIELGGALKNVIAIAVGAVRGMELGASAEAALIARGFAEMSRIAIGRGAKAATLTGLSGLGDLVLTCSHTQSRNFAYGMALGRNESLEGRPLAEGAFTAKIASQLARQNNIEAPIITAVAQVLERTITPREAVDKLLERPLRKEVDQELHSGEIE